MKCTREAIRRAAADDTLFVGGRQFESRPSLQESLPANMEEEGNVPISVNKISKDTHVKYNCKEYNVIIK